MKVKITYKTSYSEFAPYIEAMSEKSAVSSKLSAVRHFFGVTFSWWHITIDSYLRACRGDFRGIFNRDIDIKNLTAYEYLAMQSFRDFATEVIDRVEKLSLPQRDDEKKAANGLPHFGMDEGMLIFTRRYFVLDSFESASKMSLEEFLLAKKDEYTRGLYERNLSKIREANIKNKSNR